MSSKVPNASLMLYGTKTNADSLSYDVMSGSDVTLCIAIDKPLVLYILCNMI